MHCLQNNFRTSLDCTFPQKKIFFLNAITLKSFMINRKQQLFDLLQNGVFKSKLSTNKSKNLVIRCICCKPNEYPTAFHSYKLYAERNPGNITAIATFKVITQHTGGQVLIMSSKLFALEKGCFLS